MDADQKVLDAGLMVNKHTVIMIYYNSKQCVFLLAGAAGLD